MNALKKTAMIIAMGLIGCCIPGVFAGVVYAKAYYVAPSGRDSAPGTRARPWGTFARAMTALKPGDTLYLEDGAYNRTLDITVSGTRGAYVTVRALNDGGAAVNTTYPDSALVIGSGISCIEVDGINFNNSGRYDGSTYCATDGKRYAHAHCVNIGAASHIILRRIIANGSSGCNTANISLAGATGVLLEDCAASGQGRVVLNILGCRNIVVRRCWLRWTGPSTGGGDTSSIVQIYDSSNVLMENNIGVNMTRTPTDDFGIWAHYRNAAHNTFMGNVVYHTRAYSAGGFRDDAAYGRHSSYGLFEDNVAILPVAGAYHSVPADAVGTDRHVSENNTYVGDGGGSGFLLHERPNRPGQVTRAAIINCSFCNLWAGIDASWSGNNVVTAHRYNNFYKVKTCLLHEKLMRPPGIDRTEMCGTRDPGYDTARYGRGAYLIVPPALRGRGEGGADIGASVLYRYMGGVLTGIPLWPWPMEGRILARFGVSPTWEAKGGIWKTLEGVYPKR
ncbi:MAG: right-handed parallel beta-helix repeat-containing protein [Nitrospiraceae bacterium]|nr:right-handed parallel beta-helix repeat-containing protein [Nitrospiraceae bacterium]